MDRAIVKELQPDFVVCENVKGLRSMLGGAVEKKIIDDYRAIGYQMNGFGSPIFCRRIEMTKRNTVEQEDVVIEDPPVNVDSSWIIGPRAKGGKRENNYHGNFVPQIPSAWGVKRTAYQDFCTNLESVLLFNYNGRETTVIFILERERGKADYLILR